MMRSIVLLAGMVCTSMMSRRAECHRLRLRERAGTTLRTPEGLPLEKGSAFTVPLSKSTVNTKDHMQFLRQLKLLQIQMREIYEDIDEEDSFIQEDFVAKLTQQVLPEKRLATYYGEIKLGEGDDAQTFPMLFDTGSCEFWVPSVGCEEKTDPARCRKHHLYDPEKSATNENYADKVMSIKYLSGAVEGPLATDTVQIGNLVVKKQVFGMARQIDVPLLDDVVWDGIIGLAYPNEELTGEGIHPLFDTIMEQKLVLNNIFSYYLGFNGGAVTFGGVDERYMGDFDVKAATTSATTKTDPAPTSKTTKAPIVASFLEKSETTSKKKFFNYAKVTEKGYWTIEIEDILLRFPDTDKEESTGVCKDRENGRCTAIVDTGTYLIYGPQDQVNNQLGKVIVDTCDDIKNLPDIIFVLYAGDNVAPAKITLHPHDYVLEFHIPSDANSGAEEESDCVLGIGPDNDTGWTLGQVFLRSFYVVFDRDNDRIGFTRANPRAQI